MSARYFRDYDKSYNNGLPSTYREAKKMKELSQPMNASIAFEREMDFREKKRLARKNYVVHPSGDYPPSLNPSTGLPYGDWNNREPKFGETIYSPELDSTGQAQASGCSKTAEPVDTDSYSDLMHLESTPLSRAFFSERNINFIRGQIAGIIKKKYKIPIAPQPYKPTKMFMMLVYNDISCDMCQTGNIRRNFNLMNSFALEQLEKRIMKNLMFQVGYMNWVKNATTKVQIQNPQYSQPNKKELSYSRYYNGCEW